MSDKRPECGTSCQPATPDETAWYMIRDSVRRCSGLIRGELEDDRGRVCAIGAFFRDNEGAALHTDLLDEVATYNDSIPKSATMRFRRNKVLRWLSWRIKCMCGKKVSRK